MSQGPRISRFCTAGPANDVPARMHCVLLLLSTDCPQNHSMCCAGWWRVLDNHYEVFACKGVFSTVLRPRTYGSLACLAMCQHTHSLHVPCRLVRCWTTGMKCLPARAKVSSAQCCVHGTSSSWCQTLLRGLRSMQKWPSRWARICPNHPFT